ncbi:MAG: hypothetical protein ACE5IQ_11735 [Candidatus Methylomirabilales bacterium]
MKQTWAEGPVNPYDEHIVISYGPFGERCTPVALLAAGPGRTYTVQFMLEPGREDQQAQAILREVREELDLHLVELDEPDPWAYPRYHCSTASNAYGPVHWALHERHE